MQPRRSRNSRLHPFSYWTVAARFAAKKTEPRGGTTIFVILVATAPLAPKNAMRMLCDPADVLPIAISVDQPPPVTTCGNTNDVGPPTTSVGTGTTATGVVVVATATGATTTGAGRGTPVTLIGCVTVVIAVGCGGS